MLGTDWGCHTTLGKNLVLLEITNLGLDVPRPEARFNEAYTGIHDPNAHVLGRKTSDFHIAAEHILGYKPG